MPSSLYTPLVLRGGEWFGDPGSVSEETLSQIALEELHRQLGIAAQPLFINTSIKIKRLAYHCFSILK